MADRIVVLDKGRIAPSGSPLELYDRPANRFVATVARRRARGAYVPPDARTHGAERGALGGLRAPRALKRQARCLPPVTCRSAPVMKLPASEHRSRAGPAISSGRPARRIGLEPRPISVQAAASSRRYRLRSVARIRCGDRIAEIALHDPISLGHKFALRDIPAGAEIVKYGSPIGITTCPVAAGDHVHVHNLVSQRAKSRGPRER